MIVRVLTFCLVVICCHSEKTQQDPSMLRTLQTLMITNSQGSGFSLNSMWMPMVLYGMNNLNTANGGVDSIMPSAMIQQALQPKEAPQEQSRDDKGLHLEPLQERESTIDTLMDSQPSQSVEAQIPNLLPVFGDIVKMLAKRRS